MLANENKKNSPIKNQEIPSEELWLWQNKGLLDEVLEGLKESPEEKVIRGGKNLDVFFRRFAKKSE